MASLSTLPDEITVDILLKLPVKSILRCSSLSKHYYSLIRSQYFVRRHLNANLYDQAITSPILGSVSLFDGRGPFTVLEGLPPIFECSSKFNRPEIFGPVNGLYCVIYAYDRVAVWNPCTREIFNVPHVHESEEVIEKELGGYDVDRCFAYGFGCDDTTNDYKLVLMCCLAGDIAIRNKDERSFVATFYTMNICKGGEWSIPKQPVYFEAWDINSTFGVFTCGASHWIYASSMRSVSSIIAFDMATESHRIIAIPEDDSWCTRSIVTFNGFLGLVLAHGEEIGAKGQSRSFDVWVMNEYSVSESWTILHRISMKQMIGNRFPWNDRYLGIVRNRFYVTEGGWMVSYDLDSKDEERYAILDRVVESLLPYEESLERIIKSV